MKISLTELRSLIRSVIMEAKKSRTIFGGPGPDPSTSGSPPPAPKDVYGHDRPTERGKYIGQTIAGEQKVKTGKKIPIVDKETGETVFLPVREKQTKCYWTWDGEQWLTDEEWKAKFGAGKKFVKPPGMRFK